MRVRRLNAPHIAKKAAKITPFLAHVKILISQLTGLLVLAQMLGRIGPLGKNLCLLVLYRISVFD